jgi:hypothetical protein
MKRGYFNKQTQMFYSHTKANGKQQWYSIESWERKKQAQKDFNKTKRSKDYQKEWYLKNKDRKLELGKVNIQKRKEEAPLKLLFGSIKIGAKRRNIDFEIDFEFILNLWEKQNGKCYYSKVDMKYIAFNKNPFQVSIDRIESSKGYTKNNTVLCCQSINYMKNDYPIESFNLFFNSLQDALKLIEIVKEK